MKLQITKSIKQREINATAIDQQFIDYIQKGDLHIIIRFDKTQQILVVLKGVLNVIIFCLLRLIEDILQDKQYKANPRCLEDVFED